MGFGILFIGYFITFGAAFYSIHALSAVGAVVMAAGMWLLSRYCKSFLGGIYCAGVMALLQGCATALRFMGYGTPSPEESGLIGEIIYEWMLYAVLIAQTAFLVFLLLGIAKLAGEVGLVEIKRSSLKNLIVYGLYAVAWMIFFPLGERIYEISPRVFTATYTFLNLLSIIWFVMMLMLVFKCLSDIVPEEKDAAINVEEAEAAVPGIFTKVGDTFKRILTRVYTPKEVREMYRSTPRDKDGDED